MPRMIAALEDPRPHVRKVALESLLYLSDLAEWREAIRAAIPRMIEAPRKSSKDGLLLLAQIPEYREDVRPALPSIVSSVKGTTWRDHLSVLEGLSRLPAEWYEDLRPAIVEGIAEMDAPVPELDPSAGKDVLQTLSNVVEIAEWREAIRPAIPAMIAAFQRYQHMDALQRLAKMTAWHEEIRLAISDMITELDEPQLNFRDAALKALSVLAEIAELRKEILPAIPGIIAVLNTTTDPLLPNPRGPEAALICLSKLAEIADWREIRPAVPVMIAALKDPALVVPALECLTRLGNIGITCLATMANPAARLNVLGAESDVEDCVIKCFARVLVALRRRPQLNLNK
ncbi:hypothetical protein B0H14DRAFT_2815344 [Mycena olivaceomarginata]|nr:hypothetical protein B0H14DRAFT_2815344 [Mycena olivaceomarginata]